jgi:hypothetical protein
MTARARQLVKCDEPMLVADFNRSSDIADKSI